MAKILKCGKFKGNLKFATFGEGVTRRSVYIACVIGEAIVDYIK